MEPAPTDPKKSKPSEGLRYSGLGIQLLGTIGLCAWGGHLLDEHFNFRFPVCLLVLVMAAFATNMFLIYKQVNKD